MPQLVKRDKLKVVIFEDAYVVDELELPIEGVGYVHNAANNCAFRIVNELLLPYDEKVVVGKDGVRVIANEKRPALFVSARSFIPLDPFHLLSDEQRKALEDVHAIALEKQNEATANSGKKKNSFYDSSWFGWCMISLAIALIVTVFFKRVIR
jgi:hypothetical protein